MNINCSTMFAEFVKSYGPLISAFVAIFLFHQTTLRDKKKEKKQRRLERKNRIKYITNIITDAIKTITNQTEKLEVNIKDIRTTPTEFHPIALFASSSIETLTNLLNEENSFVAITKLTKWMPSVNEVDIYSDLVAKADFAHALINDLKLQIQTRFTNLQSEQLNYQIATDNILTKTNSILSALQKLEMTAVDTRFITSIEAIDKELQSSETRDAEAFYNILIIPTLKVTKDFMVRGFSETDKLDELRKVSEDSARIYRQTVTNSKLHADSLEHIYTSLIEAKDGLLLSNEKIKKALECEPITVAPILSSRPDEMV